MDMTVGILIALIAVLLISRRRNRSAGSQAARRATHRAQKRPVHAYASASVRCGPGACGQAKQLHNRRFLSSEVPQLPLPSCNQQRCSCRYARYEDRRTAEDRRDFYSMQTNLYSVSGDADRRLRSRGRRATDMLESPALQDQDYDNFEWTT